MTVELQPFEAGLGADASGVDIRRPLSPIERDQIRAAWLNYLVLRFREQPISDEQHMAFTRQFGELEFNPAALIEKQYGVHTQTEGRRREIPPEISVISNIVEDGKAIGGLAMARPSGTPTARLSKFRPLPACCGRWKSRLKAARPIF
jgi:taurine dioxygenase